MLSGWPNLPIEFTPSPDSSDAYQDMMYRGRLLRSYSMARDFFNSGESTQVVITVAKTQNELEQEVHALWWPNLLRESATLVLVLGLMLLDLRHELKPLAALRGAVLNRERTDLRPIRLKDLPLELRPVVETINHYATRIQKQIDSRKRFIEDAAHQLRTPMALLSTQLYYAASLADTLELKKILTAISQNRRQITQLVNQLLSLSQAESLRAGLAARTPLDLHLLAHDVLVDLAPLAEQREIDLGLGVHSVQASLIAHRPALYALLFNLMDNAIRYTPTGGKATVSILKAADQSIVLEVEDTGPGIPPELRSRVFERFNRGSAANTDGTGLGLAIVQEAAAACGGDVSLHTGRDGKGLRHRQV